MNIRRYLYQFIDTTSFTDNQLKDLLLKSTGIQEEELQSFLNERRERDE